ncbi:hypothetical protein LTR16_007775, partial [Cryomyces antarcticus]
LAARRVRLGGVEGGERGAEGRGGGRAAAHGEGLVGAEGGAVGRVVREVEGDGPVVRAGDGDGGDGGEVREQAGSGHGVSGAGGEYDVDGQRQGAVRVEVANDEAARLGGEDPQVAEGL